MDKAKAFSVIKAARELVGHDKASEETAAQYETVVRRFFELRGEQPDVKEDHAWINMLDHYEDRKTFKTYKSAVCWHLRREIRVRLKLQDQQQRESDLWGTWLNRVAIIEQLLWEYRSVHAHAWTAAPKPDEELKKLLGPSRAGSKKKLDLIKISKAYPEWMSTVLRKSRYSPYLDAVRVLTLIGCRPEELEDGISVQANEAGKLVLTVKHGAKVTKEAGQPWRRITLPETNMPHAWQEVLKSCQSFTVKIDSKDGLRRFLHRISEKCFRKVPLVTAYVFRHALATRIRGEGLATEELAGFLGHSVAKTQAVYGQRPRGRGVMPTKRGAIVEVPRAVKPIDRSGLDKLLAQRVKRSRAPS